MTAKKSEKITPDEKGVLESDIKQLMTPRAIKELGALTPTMQQFLIRWQDKRDLILSDQLKKEMKSFLMEVYEKDNENLCKNVSKVVCKEVAEVISPIWKKLEDLATGQNDINALLKRMNARLDKMEKRVYDTDDKRIKNLERRVTKVEKTIVGIIKNK